MAVSSIEAFLSRPFDSWMSALLYLVLCTMLGGMVIFLVRRYQEILQPHTPLQRPDLKDYARHSVTRPTSSPSNHIDFPKPRSPLSQVTTASDASLPSPRGISSQEKSSVHSNQVKSRPLASRYLAPKPVAIGRTSESRIAQRRRLSAIKRS